jgi:hypothetical protein
MKFVFLSGGLLGFVTGLFTSWQLDHAADRVFLDASVGCLAGALLFRWFWTVLVGSIRETILARNAAAVLAAAAKTSATTPTK